VDFRILKYQRRRRATIRSEDKRGRGFRGRKTLLSQTCEYALKAATYIARHGGDEPVSARDIAAGAGIPQGYLQKLLSEMVRAGVLRSSRGIGGGFRLSRPADEVLLKEVIAPFDDAKQRLRCPFGSSDCEPGGLCAVHERWGDLIESFTEFLETTTLADLAADRDEGSAGGEADGTHRVAWDGARPRGHTGDREDARES